MSEESARRPRSTIKLNGTNVTPLSWTVDTNTLYQADTFRCSLPLTGLPATRNLDWIAGEASIEVEVLAGFDDDLESLFFGRVDDIDVALSGRVIDLSGRDLTGKLIDTKSSEKYRNRTASDIVETLAAKHGLTPVAKATSGRVGRFYADDAVRLQEQNTDWDLLTWLAREEGYVVYVQGKELHFEPREEGGGQPFTFDWREPEDGAIAAGFQGSRLSLSQSKTAAKDIEVTVKSWNHKSKKAFKKTAKRSRGNDVQKYSYTVPGLTPDQAQKRAEAKLLELTQHEMRIGIDGPARTGLKKTDTLRLSGTGTAWDQVYFPSSVSRSFSRDDGYAWRIEAKNHAPESEPTL